MSTVYHLPTHRRSNQSTFSMIPSYFQNRNICQLWLLDHAWQQMVLLIGRIEIVQK